MTVDSASECIINPNALIRKLALREHEGNNRFIAGYANIAGIVDNQNDIVTLDALKRAWAKWKENPDYALLNLLHQNLPMAKVMFEPVIDSNGNTHLSGVDEKGLYIVAQVRDDVTLSDEVWEKIERGEYRGFSIGGRNLNPQAPVCDCEGNCTREITDLELYEVSIVDRPANRVSLFNMLKSDTLAKLSEVSNQFPEQVVTEGIIKISKTRGEKCGKYHILMETDLIDPQPFETEDTRVIYKAKEGMEYIPLFDHALLRPHGGLTGEDGHGGVNPPPLTAETPDTPKKEGGNPLSEETKEEVIEEKTDESPEDDSETSEAPEVEEAKAEDQEEAIAPMTLEVLAAELARINERLDNFEKRLPLEEESEEKVEPEETEKVEKSAEETPLETPKVMEEVKQIIQENVNVPPENLPTDTQPTESKLEPAKVLPSVEEASVSIQEPVKPVETPVETRGVAQQAAQETQGFDLASLYKMSWKDINESLERR